jgi:hypothetical protein
VSQSFYGTSHKTLSKVSASPKKEDCPMDFGCLTRFVVDADGMGARVNIYKKGI